MMTTTSPTWTTPPPRRAMPTAAARQLNEVVASLGTCGCRYPLLLDRQAGFWRHLSDGSPCLPRGIGLPLCRLRMEASQLTTLTRGGEQQNHAA